MRKRDFKNAIYNEIARTSRAIANPVRMEIIDFIANGEKCVEDISLQLNINIANASQHLQTLKRERLVKSRKEGHFQYYSLQSPNVYKAWTTLRDLANDISPFVGQTAEDYRKSNSYPAPTNYDKIAARKDICLLDVRPKEEFEDYSLPNALSMPLDELNDRLGELPKDMLLVAYCRGMFCTLADEAVKLLTKNGFRAKKIEEGVLDIIN